MGENCVKKNGFTLLEVIISMTIIAIISVGIYTGYIIMIRQTKDGQVKQQAALEAKKVVEVLQSTNFTVQNNYITLGNMTFTKDLTDYKRYLNNNYKDTEDNGDKVTKYTAKYIESMTFTPATAKTATTSGAITLNTNNSLNSSVNKIYISRINSQDHINYSADDNANIPLLNGSMELSMYLTPITGDSSHENINILDYSGTKLITTTKDIDENLVINFNNYKNADGTLPSSENIVINVYNKTSTIANIYIEKQTGLNVDLESLKGEVKIFNNRAENVSQDDIGTLYDIKINIMNRDNNENLFTGYYKKNLKN